MVPRGLLLVTCALECAAWTSISQARFGARHEAIVEELRGNVGDDYNAQRALGYLCACALTSACTNARSASCCECPAGTLPEDPLSDHGLGGGIAFARDPMLCAALRRSFRSDFGLFTHLFNTCAHARDGFVAHAFSRVHAACVVKPTHSHRTSCPRAGRC
jgi:hypothetical protein